MVSEDNKRFVFPAKLEMPYLPLHYVRREALLENMRSVVSHQKLTCMVAPQGCGKTSALIDLVLTLREDGTELENGQKSASWGTAWVNVDAQDDDAMRFWLHVFIAVGVLSANAQDGFSELPSIAQAAAKLHVLTDGPFLLVLDHFECIDNPAIESQLIEFAALAPRDFHVILSSKKLSKQMQLGSYELGHIQIVASSLRMSKPEARAFVDSALGQCTLSDEEFDQVYDLTEGWAQGVELAVQVAVTAASNGHVFLFGGTCRQVRRYFSACILSRVDSELFSFALDLSFLERFSSTLCSEVFEDARVQESLESILGDGLFLVVPCDEEDRWFRFNRLFADWLRNELLSVPLEVTRKNCLRAGEWFFNHGLVNEAAKYLLMGSDFGYVENMADALCGLKRSNVDTPYLVWLAGVSADEFPSSPLLCMLSAWACNAAARVEEAFAWTDRFEAACRQPAFAETIKPDVLEFAIKVMQMKCKAMVGDSFAVREECEELLASDSHIKPSLLSMLYQTLGESIEQSGDMALAEEMYLQAQASASVDRTRHQLFFNMLNVVKMHLYLGDLEDAESACEKLLSACPADFVFSAAGKAYLAQIYVESNRLDEAFSLARRALRGVSAYCNIDLFIDVKMAHVDCLIASSDLSEAYRVISGAIMKGEQFDVPRGVLLNAYFKQAEIAVRRHNARDLKIIESKFSRRLQTHDEYRQVLYAIICGFLAQETGDFETAAEWYCKAAGRARAHGYNLLYAKALVAALRLFEEHDDHERATAVLYKLIPLASSHGYIRCVLVGGDAVLEALREYSSLKHANAAARTFAKTVLLAAESGGVQQAAPKKPRDAGSALAPDLTDREREVLTLLNIGMSRKEISEELKISINTTKKHLSSIYSKLGVSTRDEALEAYEEGV